MTATTSVHLPKPVSTVSNNKIRFHFSQPNRKRWGVRLVDVIKHLPYPIRYFYFDTIIINRYILGKWREESSLEFRGEWPGRFRQCNQNQKVPGSNPIRCSAKLRDPTSLWGSQWPSGRKCKNSVINIERVRLSFQ